MRVTTDDALRRVDARWLGVPGWTFPWRPTRYSAYGIGAPIAIVVIFTATRLFGSGLWTIVYGLTIAIALTTYTMRLVDDERPASTLPALVWGELGAPRDSRHHRSRRGVLSLASIPVFVPASDGESLLLLCPIATRNRLFRRAFPRPQKIRVRP
jgi:hypothetical protein